MGVEVDVIIGGREAQYVLLEKEFRKFCKNVYITTDDGSLGEKGFVTTKLAQLIEMGEKIDEVIAIGPVPMMKAVVSVIFFRILMDYRWILMNLLHVKECL